jgi:hypothetical protein
MPRREAVAEISSNDTFDDVVHGHGFCLDLAAGVGQAFAETG